MVLELSGKSLDIFAQHLRDQTQMRAMGARVVKIVQRVHDVRMAWLKRVVRSNML